MDSVEGEPIFTDSVQVEDLKRLEVDPALPRFVWQSLLLSVRTDQMDRRQAIRQMQAWFPDHIDLMRNV